MARLDEDAMIDTLFAPLATDPGADRLADDAAVLSHAPGEEIVVTLDALAAGVHFLPDDPPDSIARKALRVNLSDLAAKGAEPFGYTLALALGADATLAWVQAFAAGLAEDQARYGVALLGGDTLRAAGGTHVAITAFGRLPKGAIVRRRTARPGDRLFVTGSLGDAALYLAGLRNADAAARWELGPAGRAALRDAYLHPDPPIAAALAVRDHARGAMDVSDGLVTDARKLARAANVTVRIEVPKVPLSAVGERAAAVDPAVRAIALSGGDDYQILAAVPPDRAQAFADAVRAAGRHATEIGVVVEGAARLELVADGAPVRLDESNVFRHF